VAISIAREDAASLVAFDALSWILEQDFQSRTAASAIEMLATNHAENPRIAHVVARLGYYVQYVKLPTYDKTTDLLTAVAAHNTDRVALGQVAMARARRAKRAYELEAATGGVHTESLSQRTESALRSVIKDFGDCPALHKPERSGDIKTLADDARSELFEITHLRPGKLAPEIETEDLDGKRFKLSDHRGKVVLLVFWASWCGPCMAAIPHERELVERFRGRPFVLIGVNGDEERGRGRTVAKKERVNWRSFWNGAHRDAGSISAAWNVRGWPTVYVIDPDGIVRLRDPLPTDLDRMLEELVAKAESKAGR
jgi:thiol-disulfide isomerase/thioredoxin